MRGWLPPEPVRKQAFILSLIQALGWFYLQEATQFFLFHLPGSSSGGHDWGLATSVPGYILSIFCSWVVCRIICPLLTEKNTWKPFFLSLLWPLAWLILWPVFILADAIHIDKIMLHIFQMVYMVFSFFGLFPEGRPGWGPGTAMGMVVLFVVGYWAYGIGLSKQKNEE